MAASPFYEFIQTYTKVHPNPECPSCGTFALRIYCPPDGPERTICIYGRCPDYEHVEGMPDPN